MSEYDAADGQTFGPVRCRRCGRLLMNAMEMRDGVESCQDRHTCGEVAKAREEARSTYDDLIEAGWKPAPASPESEGSGGE